MVLHSNFSHSHSNFSYSTSNQYIPQSYVRIQVMSYSGVLEITLEYASS